MPPFSSMSFLCFMVSPDIYLSMKKHPVTAVNPYMGSKIIGEEICRQISAMESIPAVILRGFNIYGDHQIPGRFDLRSARCGRRGNDPSQRSGASHEIISISRILSHSSWKSLPRCPSRRGTITLGYGQSYSNLEVAELYVIYRIRNVLDCSWSNPSSEPHIPDCSVDTSLCIRPLFLAAGISSAKGFVRVG